MELIKRKYRNCRIGKQYNNLLVVSYAGHGSKGKMAYWTCKCSCGNIKNIRSDCLGKQKTCGDCPLPKGNLSHAWKGYEDFPKDYFNTIRHGAAAKNLAFEVDMKYLWELYLSQDKKCAFTGWPIFFHSSYKEKTKKTVSLDRIDSSKGYIEGNLQWVHRTVNKLKKNIPDETFIKIC